MKATGVRLVEQGLSYVPSECALPAYWKAWSESTAGVHDKSLHHLAQCDSLAPWELKHVFESPLPQKVTYQWTNANTQVRCTVRNDSRNLNEANVLILKSRIVGAGLGLFLRPTPPSTGRQLVIPRDRQICLYSRHPLSKEDSADFASTDYLLEAQVGPTTQYFNPEVFTGEEMGRYINQGGLEEGLEELCRVCNRDTGAESFLPCAVKKMMASHCNVKFKSIKNTMFVCAAEELRSTTDAQELLVDYGLDYWVRYVVQHIHTLDRSTPMVKSVLWALLSSSSVYNSNRDLVEGIPSDLRQLYANMHCPVLVVLWTLEAEQRTV